MQEVPENAVYGTAAREGPVPAIVSQHKHGPHEKTGEKPEKREVGDMPWCVMREIGAKVQNAEEEYVASDIVYAQGQTRPEAVRGDNTLDLGQGGDILVGDKGRLGRLLVAGKVHRHEGRTSAKLRPVLAERRRVELDGGGCHRYSGGWLRFRRMSWGFAKRRQGGRIGRSAQKAE